VASKIVLFFNQGSAGFTETYYQTLNDPVAAINAIPALFYKKAVAIRAAGTVLWGVRGSNLGLQRKSIFYPQSSLYKATQGGADTDPDVISTDAVWRLYADAGYTRSIFLRGLRDSDVLRDSDGTMQPSAKLITQVNEYISAMKAAGMMIQHLQTPPDLPVPWYPVAQVSANPAGGPYSVVTTNAPLGAGFAQPNSKAVFQNVPRNDLPGFGRIMPVRSVAAPPATAILIPYRYRGSEPITYPQKMRFTLLNYQYSAISFGNFVKFSERKTGRPFGMSLGRAQAVVKAR
jgi:hypothetical protein